MMHKVWLGPRVKSIAAVQQRRPKKRPRPPFVWPSAARAWTLKRPRAQNHRLGQSKAYCSQRAMPLVRREGRPMRPH